MTETPRIEDGTAPDRVNGIGVEAVQVAPPLRENMVAAQDVPKRRPWWKRLGPMLTGAATAVGVVVGIISVVPIVFNNSSSHETLLVSAIPYRAQDVTHYVLPLDAPVDTFPESSGACSGQQASWLALHGRQFQRDYLVEVRNTAENGPYISLQNFHGDGNLAASPEGIVVECDRGSSAAVAEPAHLQLDTQAGAYFDKSQFGTAGQGVPNTPLAYNLEPGETGQIVLSLSSLRDFGGNLAVGAAVGKTVKNVQVQLPEGSTGFDFPGASTSRALLLKVEDGRLACSVLSAKFAGDCQVATLFGQSSGRLSVKP